MSYALTEVIGETQNYKVFCAVCLVEVGTMNGETILKALLGRGSIICPECGEKKCDYCGYVQDRKVALVTDTLLRICYHCHKKRAFLSPPEFVRYVQEADWCAYGKVMDSTTDEELLNKRTIGCLSSYPKLHKSTAKWKNKPAVRPVIEVGENE